MSKKGLFYFRCSWLVIGGGEMSVSVKFCNWVTKRRVIVSVQHWKCIHLNLLFLSSVQFDFWGSKMKTRQQSENLELELCRIQCICDLSSQMKVYFGRNPFSGHWKRKILSSSDNSSIQKSTPALKCDPTYTYMTKWKQVKLNAGDNDESKCAVQPAWAVEHNRGCRQWNLRRQSPPHQRCISGHWW